MGDLVDDLSPVQPSDPGSLVLPVQRLRTSRPANYAPTEKARSSRKRALEVSGMLLVVLVVLIVPFVIEEVIELLRRKIIDPVQVLRVGLHNTVRFE